MKVLLKRLWLEEEGQDLTEYALLLALIALGAIGAMKTIATTINNVFSNAATNLSGATAGTSSAWSHALPVERKCSRPGSRGLVCLLAGGRSAHSNTGI